jgi:demethoxyubiquinone hydroxylase (CLK1/Coq7/Cat5 family)
VFLVGGSSISARPPESETSGGSVTDSDVIIRPEMRFDQVRQRGGGFPADRLSGIGKALRKLHALETMAVNIYKYEISKRGTPLDIYLTAAMANEMTHLQDFQTKLYEYNLRPGKLRFGFWLVGIVLGLGSRMMGRRRILKTGIWAEKKAVRDYGHFLRDVRWDEETIPIVEKDAADEAAHVARWTRLLNES